MFAVESIKTFSHGVFLMYVGPNGAHEIALESEAAAHAYIAAMNKIAAK